MAVVTETECRAIGTTSLSQLDKLLGFLEGVAGHHPRPLKRYERAQRADGPPAVDVRLQRSLLDEDLQAELKSGTRWLVRNETVMTRGSVKELPVLVLTVTEAESTGPDVPGFWEAMGMYSQHENIREGHSFVIKSGDHLVTVTVTKLLKILERENLSTATEVSTSHRLVEVSCRVAGGGHMAGVEAIGEVKELLKDFTSLRKG